MIEQMKIDRLSNTLSAENREGNVVAIVGSFAPVHRGHFDAIHAASTALTKQGLPVESLVFTPNSEEYVRKKLREDLGEWTYERRIQEILSQDPHPNISTYVDDLSGHEAKEKEINDYVTLTIRRHLGFTACQTYLVVGSDQLASMESHLSNEANRAVCVLRPGNLDYVQSQLETPWIADAIASSRFIITEREDMENDISSTTIRKALANSEY